MGAARDPVAAEAHGNREPARRRTPQAVAVPAPVHLRRDAQPRVGADDRPGQRQDDAHGGARRGRGCRAAGGASSPDGRRGGLARQARLAFGHTKWLLRPIFAKDKRCWRVIEHSHECHIEDRETGAMMHAIGSDPRRAHGLAPVLVIADKPAADTMIWRVATA